MDMTSSLDPHSHQGVTVCNPGRRNWDLLLSGSDRRVRSRIIAVGQSRRSEILPLFAWNSGANDPETSPVFV